MARSDCHLENNPPNGIAFDKIRLWPAKPRRLAEPQYKVRLQATNSQ